MALRTTHWRFADDAERDSFKVPQGVNDGDICIVEATSLLYRFDEATDTWIGIPSETQTWAGTLTLGNVSGGNDPTLSEPDRFFTAALADGGAGLESYVTGRTVNQVGSAAGNFIDIGSAPLYASGQPGEPTIAIATVHGLVTRKDLTGGVTEQAFIIEQLWEVSTQTILDTYRLEGAASLASTAEFYTEIYSSAAGVLNLHFREATGSAPTYRAIAHCQIVAGYVLLA